MSDVFFSTESWHPAASKIMKCFEWFERHMCLQPLHHYCNALDSIAIIPFCCPEKYLDGVKERKLIRWKSREADIRLRINFEEFRLASEEKQKEIVRDVIIRSLYVIYERCTAKQYRFDLGILIKDMFPDDEINAITEYDPKR